MSAERNSNKNTQATDSKKLGIKQLIKNLMSGFEGVYPSINLAVDRPSLHQPQTEFLYNEEGIHWRSPSQGLVAINKWPQNVREVLYDVMNLPTAKELKVYVSTYPDFEMVQIKVCY